MPDANELQGVNDPAGPEPAPSEVPEGVQPGDDQVEAGDGEEPQEPEEPLEPYEIVLQGFWTVSQTLSAAYGATSSEIQTIIPKILAKTTAEDRTFIWGASGAIHHWLDSIRPAMAVTEESTKDQVQLLAEARQAGKDALDSILEFIPKEQEPQLTPVFPQATHLLAPALAVARRHTNEALRNIHTQLVDLTKEHVPQEQVRALFNTILQLTCSFQQEMDNMATNQVFLRSQIVPNLWGSIGDYWKGYPSWALPAVQPAGQNRKWDPTPELVILEDDDSTPLPGKTKGAGKKTRTQNPGEEEASEALSQHLKGEARSSSWLP